MIMLKINLEKAFDRLEWFFIYRALIYIKFPQKISKLIMHCITTSSIAITVNRNHTPFFSPSRGIRQGDPMSLYIFIICLELLSTYVHHQVDVLQKYPIQLSTHGLYSPTYFS